jgi:hypothetical protein
MPNLKATDGREPRHHRAAERLLERFDELLLIVCLDNSFMMTTKFLPSLMLARITVNQRQVIANQAPLGTSR